MNINKYIIALVILLVVGVGGYYFISSQKQDSGTTEDTSGKPVAQSHRSYEIEVTSNTSDIQPKQKATIKYRIKNDKGVILKNYETVHEKIMHFITVRKDLAYFQHLHPTLNEATGEFTVDLIFPEDGHYRIFPDFTPGDDNPQKLPVTLNHDIEVGNSSNYYAQSVVPDSESRKKYGEYDVVVTFPKDTKQQTEVTYSLNISKNGKPVTNLENYLGALGHSVILKESTLDFIHTHALKTTSEESSMEGHNMDSMQKDTASERGPDIKFATTFPESGVYKIFTQFQHEGRVQTADYIIRVQ